MVTRHRTRQLDRNARDFLARLEVDHVEAAADYTPAPSEAYKIARRSDTTSNWEPDPMAANSAIREATPLGISRVREQIRNNPLFKGALSTLVDLVIGPGIRAFAFPFAPTPGAMTGGENLLDRWLAEMVRDEDLIYAYESDWWFKKWASDPDQCDFEGKHTWYSMERLGFRESIAQGNAIIVKCARRDRGRLVPFCLQLIEGEQLDTSKDRDAEGRYNKIVGGLEFDRDNRLVGAHVYESHPHDYYYSRGSSNSKFIPASRILHAFTPSRPSADLGFTEFDAMAQHGRDRDWVMGSLLTNAALHQLLTIIHYSTNYGQGSGISLDGAGTITDTDGASKVRWRPGGHVVEVPSGDKVESFESRTPPPHLKEFTDVIDRDSARGVGMSELRYTGSWKELSYTAGRGSMLDDEMHCRPIRDWWGAKVSMPIRRIVGMQLAVSPYNNRPRYSTVSAAQYMADQLRYEEYLAVGPGREMLDPEGETDAAMAKMRGGMSSLIIEAAKQGLHWLELLMQTGMVNQIANRLGVVLDFSKGQGGQVTSTTTSSSERKPGESQGDRREASRTA